MTVRLNRWSEGVVEVIQEVFEAQAFFEEITWDLTIEHRMIAPGQPPIPVGQLIVMVPSLLLGSPWITAEAAIPVSGRVEVDRLKEYLRGMLPQLVEARSQQLNQAQQTPADSSGLILPPT